MTDNPSDDHTRISLSWLLKLVAIFCVIFGIWKLNEPVPEPPPVKPEGWDNFRLIHSQQALDIISSPDRVIAYQLRQLRGFNDDPEKDFESLSNPIELDNASVSRLSSCLKKLGMTESDKQLYYLWAPQYSLRLEFMKNGNIVNVYFDLESKLSRVRVFHKNRSVGGFYGNDKVFTTDQSLQIELAVLFSLADKIRLQLLEAEQSDSKELKERSMFSGNLK